MARSIRTLQLVAILVLVISTRAVSADNGTPRVWIELSAPSGEPDDTVRLDVTLHTGGAAIAGVQTDVSFDPGVLIPEQNATGRPLCVVNPAINKPGTAYSFQPPLCVVGGTCTAFRAIVYAIANTDPIADGSLLFSCTFLIANDALPGIYPLITSLLVASDPVGNRVDLAAEDSQVAIGLPPGTTPGPARTLAPTGTPTATSIHFLLIPSWI